VQKSRPTPHFQHRVIRHAERATYDKASVFAILDAGYVCHIGFISDGKPMIIPMSYWRDGEFIYFHSAANGRFANACANNEICLTVTHFDGLVLGHSAVNHSFNYRSVVIHGKAEVIADHEVKLAAMKSFVNHVIPHRYERVRPINDSEAQEITLLRLRIEQVSAKTRDEFPDEEHISPDWPTWIGVIPAKTIFAVPIADPSRNKAEPLPAYIAQYRGKDQHEPGYTLISAANH
jgi:hypothetical protein